MNVWKLVCCAAVKVIYIKSMILYFFTLHHTK